MSQREKETAHLGLVSRDAGWCCWLSCPVQSCSPLFLFVCSFVLYTQVIVAIVDSLPCSGFIPGSEYHPLNCWIHL